MRAPSCPRCGYDFSGAVASWDTACPLTGVCSECGYEFDWGRALARASGVEVALFEVAQSHESYALMRSVAMAFRPRALWREAIRGEPFRPRRLLAIAALGALASHLLATVVLQIAVIVVRVTDAGDWRVEERVVELALGYPAQPLAAGVLIGNVVICLLLWGVSTTMNDDRFRRPDVGRACAYWLPAAPLMAAAAELIVLIDLEPLTRQLPGAARLHAEDMAPSLTGFMLSALYGWMWFWWALAFRRYFGIPLPVLRSFLATGGVIAAAVFVISAGNLVSVATGFLGYGPR